MSSLDLISRSSNPHRRRPVLQAVRFSSFFALRRQRAQLSKLDSHALADIGLTRTAAKSEAKRPFWDVPASWRN